MVLFACAKKEDPYLWKSLQVTATAYNSVASQTDDNPSIAAWGDSLKTEIPSIAVSRNLLALGIKHNTRGCFFGERQDAPKMVKSN